MACQFLRVGIRIVLRSDAHLHAHPAPALYALIAAAYGAATGLPEAVPDGFMLDAPEQCRIGLQRGDAYCFGFTLVSQSAEEATPLAWAVLSGLESIGKNKPPRPVALGGNFTVAEARDLVRGHCWDGTALLEPVPAQRVEREAERAAAQRTLTLRFTSPLRVTRPDAFRGDGHAWFDGEYFDAGRFVGVLANRLRQIELPVAEGFVSPGGARALENRLVWLDLAYGSDARGKSLGGAVGRVIIDCPSAQAAAVLAWGQYARIGQNTRFGFGAYRIEELGPDPYACGRAAGLLEPAMRSHELTSAAEQLDLPSGSLAALTRQVLKGGYVPGPHTRVPIVQPDGARRVLCIPARRDRALQKAALATLAPALDKLFEHSSFAYRKGLGRRKAALRIREATSRGYRFAVRADFLRFFDNIDHACLRDRLEAYLADAPAVELLMAWVEAGSPFQGHGLPTGAPISPLLANLFLDGFDEQAHADGAMLVRYADDFLLLYRSEPEARRGFEQATVAATALELALNETKTRLLDLAEPFEFLGYRFERHDRWVKTPTGEPMRIEEVGWRQADRKPDGDVHLHTLPGEGAPAQQPERAWVVIGPGTDRIHANAENLLCARGDETASSTPLDRVRELVIVGRPTITAEALAALARRDIRAVLCDDAGRFLLTVSPDDCPEDPAAVTAQVAAAGDEGWRLAISRRLIAAKLTNYAHLADSDPGPAGDRRTGPALRELARRSLQVNSIEQLLGVEGAGAARWYAAFPARLPGWCRFERRVAPDATDPINVLLNIAQTALHRQLVVAVRSAGLVPSIGILHSIRPGHAALASDLQEPFRHLMDRAVLATARVLRPTDFKDSPDGPYAMSLSVHARRLLLTAIYRSFALGCADAAHREPCSYLHHFHVAARSLRRNLLDRGKLFEIFEHPSAIVGEAP